jgi:hypothetical protein
MKFSERIGANTPRTKIQKDEMDGELRSGLWDVYSLRVFETGYRYSSLNRKRNPDDQIQKYFRSLWHELVNHHHQRWWLELGL